MRASGELFGAHLLGLHELSDPIAIAQRAHRADLGVAIGTRSTLIDRCALQDVVQLVVSVRGWKPSPLFRRAGA
jgi:hypothetical protein